MQQQIFFLDTLTLLLQSQKLTQKLKILCCLVWLWHQLWIMFYISRSDKRNLCKESVYGKKNCKTPNTALPPPIPMSPIVEKMEGLKAIRNRSNSLRLDRLAFYRHLEKVETMRSFWELKHVELEGGNWKVKCPDSKFFILIICMEVSN